jgi:hypothetical protein
MGLLMNFVLIGAANLRFSVRVELLETKIEQ